MRPIDSTNVGHYGSPVWALFPLPRRNATVGLARPVRVENEGKEPKT